MRSGTQVVRPFLSLAAGSLVAGLMWQPILTFVVLTWIAVCASFCPERRSFPPRAAFRPYPLIDGDYSGHTSVFWWQPDRTHLAIVSRRDLNIGDYASGWIMPRNSRPPSGRPSTRNAGHSYRKAIAGSTFAARSAGGNAAAIVTTAKTPETTNSAIGSKALVWNK